MNAILQEILCHHCGKIVNDTNFFHDEKYFCCNSCKTVYEILQENNLCQYYSLNQTPGISPTNVSTSRFSYLDDTSLQKKLLDFTDGTASIITLYIPNMHCSSCLWLLENLYKIHPGILHSRVDFLKKNLTIKFSEKHISLRSIVELLTSLGYEPYISLDSAEKIKTPTSKALYYKIGIAGFCFGNVMLLSFPEYLSSATVEPSLQNIFNYLNLFLSLPIVFYCSQDYFISAVNGLKKKIINIDFPIALGIVLLFLRSVYEILTQTGVGFIDSLTGLVFFLLIGKLFQQKTYERLHFERDYKSYFPLAVTIKKENGEITIPLEQLSVGDVMVIRNNEIIPADAMLVCGDGFIDYSFVTGESIPVPKVLGEIIYAGGKQQGSSIELSVLKEVSQSYLTQLWNNALYREKEEGKLTTLSNTISKYFTIVVLFIAIIVGGYWFSIDITKALNAFTGILIIACPCALAIAIPFALGNAMRILGKNKLYLKNTSVLENLASVDTVVFDKTGTITYAQKSSLNFVGKMLTEEEKKIIASVVKHSTHPLSKVLYEWLDVKEVYSVQNFEEKMNEGVQGMVNGKKVCVGSLKFLENFVNVKNFSQGKLNETQIYISFDNEIRGYCIIYNAYRNGIKEAIRNLSKKYFLALLSGDNDGEKYRLEEYFPSNAELHFHQTPKNKLEFIQKLQQKKKKVVMLGDGLNDAAALKQSNVGIAVTEDINTFSPACDVIMDSSVLSKIDSFIKYARTSVLIVFLSFGFAFFYNVIGLSYAIQGNLSPLIAAIIMPLSSLTIVFLTTMLTRFAAKRLGL